MDNPLQKHFSLEIKYLILKFDEYSSEEKRSYFQTELNHM